LINFYLEILLYISKFNLDLIFELITYCSIISEKHGKRESKQSEAIESRILTLTEYKIFIYFLHDILISHG